MGDGVDEFMDHAEQYDFDDPSKRGPSGDQLAAALQESGIIMSNPNGGDDYCVAKKYTNEDGTINEELVYQELAQLIAEGNAVVKNLRYVDPNAEGALGGMASVLASMRQMLADFIKIHSDFIKHKQKFDIEKFKEDSKMRLLERKHQLDMEKLKFAKTIGNSEEEQTNNGQLSFSQQDLLKLVRDAAKKELPMETKE